MSRKGLLFAVLLVFSSALFTSCCYHAGVDGTRQNIRLGYVENRSREVAAGSILTSQLAECLNTVPGIFAGGDGNASRLDAAVESITTSSHAKAEIRDKKSRNDDSDAYQTVLHRMEMVVSYSVVPRNGGEEGAFSGKVTGIANVPLMHDINLPMQSALREAARDASQKIVNAIADRRD